MVIRQTTSVLLAAFALSSCLDTPVPYAKERGALKHAPAATVLVATVERADGSVSAKLEPSSSVVQVVKASASSAIAGAAVSFPPGTVLVATDITVSLGATLVPDAEDAELTAKIPIDATAPSVAVASTVALSTAGDFEVTLPLPQGASLTTVDTSANLIVIYKIKKGDETVIGVYLRDQMKLTPDGFAVISTRYFGTFQVVRLKNVLSEQREIVAPPPKPLIAPVRRYFAPGFSGSAQSLVPARVGIGPRAIQTGLRSSTPRGE